jgi:hypothetical protein
MPPTLEERLTALEERLAALEKALGGIATRPGPELSGESAREIPAPPWKHLVIRRHPWRKQLYLRGRNMTVRQLVGGVKANQFTDEQAAENYDLPVEAIREAFAWFEANPEVIDLDAAHERYLRKLRGEGRGPRPVP